MPARGWGWALPALAVLAIAWGPALAGPFQFDDRNVIVGYDAVHSLAAWWQSQPGIRPLLKFSYALNWTISSSPFGFHLVNLALHALNTLLLFAWLRRVLPAPARGAALFATLLWSLHPALTEAVTYISGRSVSFAATFALLALWLQARGGARVGAWLALCTLLALAVRETMWVLPAVLWLVAWLRGEDAGTAWRQSRGAFLVVAAAVVFFLVDASHQRMLWRAFDSRDVVTQLWTQVEAWRWFAAHALLLSSPVIDPDIPERTSASMSLALQLSAWLAVAAVAAWRVVRARDWRAGGVLIYLLWLLPGNGFVPRLDVANDRHLYLPLAGLAVVVAIAGAALARQLASAWATRFVAVVALLLLAYLTLARNLDYVDEVSLWRATVAEAPQKSRPWNNLGDACRRAGDTDCARDAFLRAAALDPSDPQPRVNLFFLSPDDAR